MEHEEEELRERVEALRKGVKVYKELLQSQGWVHLVNELKGQQRRIKQELLQADNVGLDGLIEMAKAKSELAGIEFVLNWPSSMVRMDEEEIQSLMETLQNEDDPQ